VPVGQTRGVEATRLDIGAIIDTGQRLAERVDDRFSGRGISRLAADLVDIARRTDERIAALSQPRWALRSMLGVVILVALVVAGLTASTVRLGLDIEGADEWLLFLQTLIQDVVFLGIAAAFLVGLEGRLKRREALTGLHQLRSLAHVIDMHQLTKDPDASLHPDHRAEHSPARTLSRWELGRYLDYCSEMLAITSKLAALYAQASQDAVVLSTVMGVQDLTGSLSNKIWQKIMILDQLEDPDGRSPSTVTTGAPEPPTG
jgi:hypothetical protein